MKYYIIYILFAILFGVNSAFAQSYDNYFFGLAKYNNAEYAQAIGFFTNALNDDIPKQKSLEYLAYSNINLGKIDKAIEYFDKLSEIDITEGSYGLARCYALKNNTPDAVKQLRIHLNQKDKHTRSSIILDDYFLGLKETVEWKELWTNDWYNKYEDLFADAYFLIKDNKNADALDVLDDLIDRKPRYAKAYVLRAGIYDVNKDYKNAIKDYSTAIELKKKNYEYYIGRANIYLEIDKIKDALVDIKKARELNPLDAGLMLTEAKILYKNEKETEAKRLVSIYLKYFGTDAEAVYLLGKCFFAEEKYNKAIEFFSNAIELKPAESKYLLARGNSFVMLDKYEEAIDDFSMALDLNPSIAQTYLSRGIARLSTNDNKGACYDFNKAYSLGSRAALEWIQSNCREK